MRPAIASGYVEIVMPRGFDPDFFIVAGVAEGALRLFHTPSYTEARVVRDSWREGNFVVPGEERTFS